jgi:hypothetical protein
VNIDVSGDQDVVSEPRHIQVAEVKGVGEVLHTIATYRARCLSAADQVGRHVRVCLVHQALGQERCVHLSPAFHEHAQDPPFAQLIEQWRQGDSTVRSRREPHDLGGADAAISNRSDERVGADDPSGLTDAKL